MNLKTVKEKNYHSLLLHTKGTFSVGQSYGTKISCWRANNTLGQDKPQRKLPD